MPLSDLLGFILMPFFFSYWFWVAGRSAFRTTDVLKTDLGRRMWGNVPIHRVRRVSLLLFAVGLVCVGHIAWELSQGTFRWRGSPKQYGFRDLLP